MNKFILSFFVCMISISASAYDFKVGDLYYNIISIPNRTVEVTHPPYPIEYYQIGSFNIPPLFRALMS